MQLTTDNFASNCPLYKGKVGIAVSGGGDSIALCHLLLQVYKPEQLFVLHLNHSLRAESDEEQRWLESQMKGLGVSIVSQKWEHDGVVEGNTQQAARYARYQFFAEACCKHELECVMVAHSSDDIAETTLMRLGRGSGLKGLAAMEPLSENLGVEIARPLLNFSRKEIRVYLKNNNIEWLDDPSNVNDVFLRPRVRKMLQLFDEVGLSRESIAASAKSLRRAETALNTVTNNVMDQYTEENKQQKITLKLSVLNEPEEIKLRVLEKIILKINPQPLAPRTSKRLRLIKAIKSNNLPTTLGGVKISKEENMIVFVAENKLTKLEQDPVQG